jgi:hypothetical protein
MKIPEEISIAGITYQIKLVPRDHPKLKALHAVGLHFMEDQIILIEENLKGDYKNQVCIHEIIHGILEAMDVANTETLLDEQFVESLSQLLYQVIKQL